MQSFITVESLAMDENALQIALETKKNQSILKKVSDALNGTMFILDREKDTESANVGSILEQYENPRPTITSVSDNSLAQNNTENKSFNNNNINDSADSNFDPNARKSKDDTIYDSSEIEDLFDDYEDSGMPDEVDPRDPYGRTTGQMIDDENFELNALLDKALTDIKVKG